jgi:hypothetical protein
VELLLDGQVWVVALFFFCFCVLERECVGKPAFVQARECEWWIYTDTGTDTDTERDTHTDAEEEGRRGGGGALL